MPATVEHTHQRPISWVRLFHAILLAGAVPLFLGAMLSDIAYSSTYEIQWNNFASWLIAGGLVVSAFAVLFAFIDLLRSERRGGRALVYFLLLMATWCLGFINALIHAMDAWAAMPAGLVFSIIVVVFACVATWMGFASLRSGSAK